MGKNAVMACVALGIMALCSGIEMYQDRDSAFNVEYCKVIVGKNDTIWGISEKHFEQQDRYRNFLEFVDHVRKDNNLVGANAKQFIKPGDILIIKLNKRK